MALILAVNPGNQHNPTLSRLARELPGLEIMGASSCSVAISAIRKRVPDVLLLPARPAKGQAELMAHLASVPGGVPTLTLPPIETADPGDLARQIRQLLAGAPLLSAAAPATTKAPTPSAPAMPESSEYLIAAATATIAWAQARRAAWSERADADERHEHTTPGEPIELAEPFEPSGEPDETDAEGGQVAAVSFLPRAAAIAAALAMAVLAVACWPQIRGVFVSNAGPAGVSDEAAAPAAQAPVVPPPAAMPQPDAYDATRTVQARQGETTTLTLTPETTIAVTSNEPAEVLIDGTRVGDTPYEGRVGLGAHTVTVRTAGAERQLTVDATSTPVRLEVDLSKP